MGLLIVSAIYVRHYSHKLIIGDAILMLDSLKIAKILPLKTHHLSIFNVDPDFLRKPARDGPKLLALVVLLQTRIEDQNRRDAMDCCSRGKLSVSSAFVAPCTYLQFPLKA